MLARLVLFLLVAFGGVGLALQIAWNARLRTATGSAVLTTMISVSITLLLLALVWASGTTTRGSVPAARSIPLWAWGGGICAAYYLVSSLLAIPKLGTATVFSLVIAGQMGAAIILDWTGAFGVPHVPLSVSRIVGAVLLIIGVVLVQKT